MRVVDMLVRCLENEGVKYIFGIPGEETLDLVDALNTSSIELILVRHEQGAAFMADVYGRLTGKAGVCLATLGPGATNLITGIADANLDRAPVVAITGQAALERIHKESHQYVDVVEIFRPITKWNTRLLKAETTQEVIRKAFKLAQTEKPGATHIEIPEDVAAAPVIQDDSPLAISTPRPASPEPADLEAAAQLIREARNAIILAGNGVIRSGATSELMAFAEANNIPVASTFMGKGIIPHGHPLNLQTIGLQAFDYVACGFDAAELVIAIGYDFVEYAPKYWNSSRDKTIIHLDSISAEVDAYYQPRVEVVANLRETLTALKYKTGIKKNFPMVTRLREIIQSEFDEHRDSKAFPVKPQKIIHDARHALRHEDILISDVGAHKLWISRMYPAYQPNTVLISNGFAAMGFALPGAIAAKLAYPEKKVLAITGDGGFLMNSQELETALRLNLSFVVMVVKDGGYGLIRWKQDLKFKKHYGVEFGNPDLVRYAESFGAKGYRLESTDDLLPLLTKALNDNTVSVIDVPVDYSENLKLSERLGKHICPI